jgi:two-component system, sensor histidine kinase LadS
MIDPVLGHCGWRPVLESLHRVLLLLPMLLPTLLLSATAAEPLRLNQEVRRVELGPTLALLVDPDRSLGVEDVLALPFEPLGTDARMNYGYTRAALWLRLELASDAAQPTEWRLVFEYPSLDLIAMYDADRPEAPALRSGDTLRFAERVIAHRQAVFPIELPAHGKRTLLLRIQSEGSLTIDATLWQAAAFAPHSEAGYAAHGLYFGMVLVLLIYNLLLYAVLRDRTFLHYVLFVTSFAIGMAGLNGFGQQFLWPDSLAWTNRALPVGLVAAGLTALLFTRAFLDTAVHTPRWDRVLLGGVALQSIALLVALLAPVQPAMKTMTLASLVACSLMTAAGLHCLLRGVPAARLFALAWTLLLAGALVQALRNLTLLPTSFFTLNGMQIGSALEMLLLSFALAARFSELRKQKDLAQDQALVAQAAMVQTLRDQERVLEQHVDERTRALAEANRRLSTLALQDVLTGLPNRAALETQLERAIANARRQQTALGVLMIDLDLFKPINDRYGHQAGDRVLVEVADRLRGCTRDSDLVARLGGDEFVMVSELVADAAAAHRLADRVLGALRLPFIVEGDAVGVRASIGVVVSARGQDDPTALLRQADLAMYQAKREGRDRYVATAQTEPPAPHAGVTGSA